VAAAGAATLIAPAALLFKQFERLVKHMSSNVKQRGITVMDLALNLFVALSFATTVISVITVDSAAFWALVAHLHI